MANHKSAEKRIRNTKTKRTQNRYQGRTVRNAVKKLRAEEDKDTLVKDLPKVVSQIDKLAKNGDAKAARFPMPFIDKQRRHAAVNPADAVAEGIAAHRYDVSYSGLKTAAINQIDQFWDQKFERTNENIAAAFQDCAVKILLSRLLRAVEDTGLTTVVAGGGVAANSRLREILAEQKGLTCVFPPLKFCTDNGAMIAGLGYQYLSRGETSPWTVNASARVQGFKKNGRG